MPNKSRPPIVVVMEQGAVRMQFGADSPDEAKRLGEQIVPQLASQTGASTDVADWSLAAVPSDYGKELFDCVAKLKAEATPDA